MSKLPLLTTLREVVLVDVVLGDAADRGLLTPCVDEL